MTAAEQHPGADGTPAAGDPPSAPFFQVVRGNPGPVEVGILTAVLATAQGNAAGAGEYPTGVKDDWGSYEDRLRPAFGYNPSSFLNRRLF